MADPQKFATERTRELLAGDLSKLEREFVENIEEFGCQVLSVTAATPEASWSYTLGVYDTCGKPEMIVIGLSPRTASAALNEAVRRLHLESELTGSKQSGILGKVDVEFRTADSSWVELLMNSARWFNQGWNFPVLQVIYPDADGIFPEEDGFDKNYQQPLLQLDKPDTDAEQYFRASNDPSSSLYHWKFADGPHTCAYLSGTVHRGEEEIVYVSHDSDGDWQFLGDSMSDGGGPVVVCLHHPIEKDPSLNELADLPLGWYAQRTNPEEPWVRFQTEEAPDED